MTVILILVSILIVSHESLGQTSLPLITLDKEEYNPYDKVIVTINAPEKNENPTQADTLVISVSNQSGPLATIRLFETSQNNGIFEGSFILTPDMARFPGDVSVSKGDHILLLFQPDKDNEIVKEVFVRFPPESQYPDPIKIPFSQNELVVIGNIVSKEKILSKNQTIYNIKVEEYLKNPKPYDMITALGDGINEDIQFTDEVTYYNRPIFDVGNKVFVYLKKENGTFKISPQSFTLAKNHVGPPTDVWPTGPSKFEFEFNEPITISGLVKKAYLYDAEKRGENTTAYVKIYNPNNELYASELLETNLDGTFTYPVKIKGKLGIDGLYNYDTGLPHQNYQSGFFIKPFQLSPLKQFKSGTDPYFVNCRENLELVIKPRDNSPACVKPTSLERLLKQGWVYAHDNNGKYDRNREITTVDGLSSSCENQFKPRDFEFTVFSNGTSYTVNHVPVFLMKPNSTGKFCLNYWRIIPEMNYSGKVTSGIGKNNSDVQDVTVVAYPDTMTIDDTNKTIAYTITASKDSGGFYRFSPLFSNCGGIPIAIGFNSTHSFDNDFPWLWEKVPCMVEVANYQITGLTGIDVAYITKEYR